MRPIKNTIVARTAMPPTTPRPTEATISYRSRLLIGGFAEGLAEPWGRIELVGTTGGRIELVGGTGLPDDGFDECNTASP